MSNKMSIQWHQEGYENSVKYLQRERETLERYRQNVERLANDVAFHKEQIETAIKKGMDSFDSERFLKKQKDKTP